VGSGSDEAEMDRVLTDRQAVAVIELPLLNRLAVDERAIRASEIDEPELLSPPLEASVVPAGRRVAEDHVVVRRPAHTQRVVARAVAVAGVRA